MEGKSQISLTVALERLPKRLQSTLFHIEVMKAKIVETYDYKSCDDPFLRELFWEKIVKLRDLIERNVEECYYAGDCVKVLNFFVCAFGSIIDVLRPEIDELVTSHLDGLIATNLRVVFKTHNNTEYISMIEEIIEKSGSVGFVKTVKCLKALRTHAATQRSHARPMLPEIGVRRSSLNLSDQNVGTIRKKPKRGRYDLPSVLPTI